MAATNIAGMIENTLKDAIKSKRMFTAFDITKQTRSSNPGVYIFHDVVKAFVHDYFEKGEFPITYDRTLVSIANPEPWCYYIIGQHDPAKYGNATGPQTQTQTQTQAVLTPTPTPKVNTKAQGVAGFIKATFGGIISGK